jgi:uncharacterized protein (DUF302 family)
MEKGTIHSTSTGWTFEEARKRVEEKAGQEGFRVLHVHDVQATLKEKGFTIDPTVIVEVCNAGLASQALGLDPRAALMMPCKVTIQEKGGEVVLSTLLPEAMVQGESLTALARQVGTKLVALVDSAARTPSNCCTI